jgi:peptidoglycan/xylan/chitin deacetylase (PgdA/CDA1 family)
LYCDWTKRDSLLVTKKQFTSDLLQNYSTMKKLGIEKQSAPFFLPPYEWYNDTIAAWTKELGLQLINYTPGTKSNADYTTPAMKNYIGSSDIFKSIMQYEEARNLNGFILLLHVGTDAARTDKFYYKLPQLVGELKKRGYEFVRIDKLLK